MLFTFYDLHFCEVAEEAPVIQLPKESKGQGIVLCTRSQIDYMKREKVCASMKRNQMRAKDI